MQIKKINYIDVIFVSLDESKKIIYQAEANNIINEDEIIADAILLFNDYLDDTIKEDFCLDEKQLRQFDESQQNLYISLDDNEYYIKSPMLNITRSEETEIIESYEDAMGLACVSMDSFI